MTSRMGHWKRVVYGWRSLLDESVQQMGCGDVLPEGFGRRAYHLFTSQGIPGDVAEGMLTAEYADDMDEALGMVYDWADAHDVWIDPS